MRRNGTPRRAHDRKYSCPHARLALQDPSGGGVTVKHEVGLAHLLALEEYTEASKVTTR